ncbi:MAG TPA: hypothetical protein VHL98_04625, partial [Microvirga sp.]|nr:hypothetical protein [Microvirga sp.]
MPATLFTATNSSGDIELWVSDGTVGGTRMVTDIRAGGSSFPLHLASAGDKVYFQADNGTSGAELWVSDGTA